MIRQSRGDLNYVDEGQGHPDAPANRFVPNIGRHHYRGRRGSTGCWMCGRAKTDPRHWESDDAGQR